MDSIPSCFQLYQNENNDEIYRNLNMVELSLIERFWLCKQVQQNILSIDEINNRYQIDIDMINVWIINLIPSNDGASSDCPIDSIGLEVLQQEYDKELVNEDDSKVGLSDDEERILKVLKEQMTFTQERLCLYNLLQVSNHNDV